LPGRKYDTYFDPEGFLSTFPAIVSCLLGVFAGLLLANPSVKDQQKVIWLIAAGLVLFNLAGSGTLNFLSLRKYGPLPLSSLRAVAAPRFWAPSI